MPKEPPEETDLKRTASLCPECLATVGAEIFEREGKVWIRKSCPRHGTIEDVYWGDYEMYKRAERWAQLLGNSATVVAGESAIGGGSLPGGTLPTRLVVIKLSGEAKVQDMAQRLRQHRPPIIGRVAKNSLLLDLRCVFPEEDEVVIEAVREAIAAFDHS